MSQLLLADLTSLSNESKRRSPDVKAAADLALSNLRADFEGTLTKCKGVSGQHTYSGSSSRNRSGSVASQPLRTDLSDAETKVLLEENLLLKPIALACNPKTHVKVAGLGVALLQRVVAMQVIPGDAVAPLLGLLSPLIAKGDIELQLKLLQTFSALLLSYPSIHGELLSSVLHLCFRLQDSKAQVVSSTAAATIRQVVMIVFEKVVEEDRILDGIKDGGEDAAVAAPLAALTIDVPGTDGVTLFPSSADAYRVLLDLNSLAQEEPANFLNLSSLPRTFTLELIESVLTNHASLVRAHPEFLYTLRRSTCPMLIRALGEKLSFPTTLRFVRLLFVLLRQFSMDLVVEVEILMSLLLRFMSSNADEKAHRTEVRWHKIVALEVGRSLCSDGLFVRNLWDWFDGQESSAKVFTQLVRTLQSLVAEESEVVGAATAEEIRSPDASTRPSIDRQSTTGGGLYEAAAGMASAVFNPLGSHKDEKATLGLSSAPSIQFVDQLEKAEPPTAPSTYVLLLASQSLVHLAQSLAQHVLPAYSSFVNSRPGSSKEAPPRLDLSQLDTSQSKSMRACRSMADAAYKPLRSALVPLLSARVDDAIFCEILTAVRNWTNTCGVLGLDRARDSFISSVAALAAPRQALLDVDEAKDENRAQLSERNLAACRVLVHVAVYLSGILDDRWLPVLTAISESEFLVRRAMSRRASVASQGGSASVPEDIVAASPSKHGISPSAFQPGFSLASSPLDSRTGRPQLLAGLDHASILKEIERCFENSTTLSHPAFKHFLDALCTLTELTAQQTTTATIDEGSVAPTPLSTPSKIARHSRADSDAAGILTRVAKGGLMPSSVVIADLGLVLRRNVGRLVQQPAPEGWDRVTSQLLSVASERGVKIAFRTQAAETLSELLVQATELSAGEGSLDESAAVRCQKQIFQAVQPLSIQANSTSSGDSQVRQVGIKTVQEVVEKYGHALKLGWESIFEIAVAACAGTRLSAPGAAPETTSVDNRRTSVTLTPSKVTLPLVKLAFSFVQRICTDLLASLTLAQLKLCIETVQEFAICDEINVALTAASSFWGITAELSSRSAPDGQASDEIIDIWMRLLSAFEKIAGDSRPEVRNTAISGLFRVLTSYGSILHAEAWSKALKTIVYPLIENVTATAQMKKQESAAATAAFTSSAMASPQKSRGRRTSSGVQLQTVPPPATEKQWQETCVVAFEQLGSVVGDFLLTRIVGSSDFLDLWDELLAKIKAAYLSGPAAVSQAAIKAFDSILRVDIPTTADQAKYEQISQAWQRAWQTWASIADGASAAPTSFTQTNLVTLVGSFTALYRCQPEPVELEAVPRLQKVVTYSQSPDTLNDVDSMTPLQTATWKTIMSLQPVPGLPSKVMTVLAERIALPFTLKEGADVAGQSATTAQRTSQPTFVAVHKAAVQEALSCYEKWENEEEIYTSGAFNTVLASLAIPIKLRYECPPSYKYPPSDKAAQVPRPLWQEATLAHCTLLRGASQYLLTSADILTVDQCHSLWRQLLSTTQATFEADCTALKGLSPSAEEEQAQSAITYETAVQDQAYDVMLLSAFERHIWPILGSKHAPADAIQQFASSLARASRLFQSPHGADGEVAGTVVEPESTPREVASFACLDLLFLFCSDQGSGGSAADDHRVAALCTSALLGRVSTAVRQYVADARLRGGAPFPRLRDEELFVILSHLLDLKLRKGTLAAALDADPCKRLAEAQQENDTPSIKSLSQQSTRAVLFALHGPLCDLLALPSQTPSLAGSTSGGAAAQLVDPPELTRSIPQPPDSWQYSARIGQHNVLNSKRLNRTESRRLQDLARACLEVVSEAL